MICNIFFRTVSIINYGTNIRQDFEFAIGYMLKKCENIINHY